jgi:hypothetical protein
MKPFLFLCLLFFSLLTSARAADITAMEVKGIAYIVVSGELVSGDEVKFNNLAIAHSQSNTIVMLESPGGLADVGMEIGRTIYIKGFAAVVSPGKVCASACALAWIAARHRMLAMTSEIGFHAVFTKDTGQADVSGAGNALVGQYLQQLGFSTSVIIFATSAQPDSMAWLTQQTAQQIGLTVDILPLPGQPAMTPRSFGQNPGAQAADQSGSQESSTTGAQPSQATPLDVPTKNWVILSHGDLVGTDFAGMPIGAGSSDECQKLCASRDGCTAYTYNVTHKGCFLKEKALIALQYTGAVSGYRNPPNSVMQIGATYGDDIRFRTVLGQQIMVPPFHAFHTGDLGLCQDDCVGNHACVAFNYEYKSGECLFLRAKKPTRPNPEAVSGMRVK